MNAESASPAASGAARFGRWLGPALFVVVLLLPAPDLAPPAQRTAALAAWMAVWWATEAVPLAATSLLPLVVLPLLGVQRVAAVAPAYAHHIVFLFLGGFVLALAVEGSGLHRRLALAALTAVGTSARRLVWAFLLVTAGLSMWLSNTATALMMLPIAEGVARRLDRPRASTALFLAVAYGASIGGMGTLIGTPPNLVLAGMAPELVPGLAPLGFARWMLFSLPLLALLLPAAGLWLGRGLATASSAAAADIVRERGGLGRMTPAERRAGLLFAATAVAWITRAGVELGPVRLPGWSDLLPDPELVSDAVPAVAAAILATVIPAGDGSGAPLVSWERIRHGVPWGILLLFGGGFALAAGVRASGLDGWLADVLGGLAGWPLPLLVLSVCLLTTTATELTSNTATATLLMPVMAALAAAAGTPPYLLMVPAALSASCAFMLPVATPPNAIVMGTGRVTGGDLLRHGAWMNLVGAAVITALVLTLGRLVLPT